MANDLSTFFKSVISAAKALPEPGFRPLLECIARGDLDGLFVSKDLVSYVTKHPLAESCDGSLLQAPGGYLFFKRNAFQAYGYETFEDFAKDCEEGRLKATTPAGAVSLGEARRVEGRPIELVLMGTGLAIWPRFLAETDQEAKEMETILLKAYPQCTIKKVAQSKRFSPFIWVDPGFVIKAWPVLLWKAPPRLRRLFAGMLGSALLTTAAAIAHLFLPHAGGLTWIGLILFFVFQVLFLRELKATGPLSLDGKPKKDAQDRLLSN